MEANRFPQSQIENFIVLCARKHVLRPTGMIFEEKWRNRETKIMRIASLASPQPTQRVSAHTERLAQTIILGLFFKSQSVRICWRICDLPGGNHLPLRLVGTPGTSLQPQIVIQMNCHSVLLL